ncbi:putative serine/threonine-protein kinase YabT [Paraliobacillus quinghaiensis]|uniref:Serine/threonine-protein kinase YabT n=1 Tax=Paraliobacillus quinghaiensis TaxID=470815 RepID=A0A917TTD6_9BACI|nr:protein kinase [Paraliobacillus quinghaiensis]GGM36449.1 putative serine/threonine-protein kinase YabT [Paraliobacillus quinghaiensis]
MNPSKKPVFDLRPGSIISGKWHRQVYVVQKQLGKGAIGTVYLCKRKDGRVSALKISEKAASITTEVNVLKHLSKVQGTRLGPSLIDVDDWIDQYGTCYSFYVMEYVQGVGLASFLRQRGKNWLGVLLLQLLKDLERLHHQGWVFGDLKLDNVIVSSSPPRLRWIDVGGTTQIGRSIKEYTEFYDRGYWQAGTRKAEPSYDLFALAMMALHYAYPNQFDRGRYPARTLREKVRQSKVLMPYQACLEKALQGGYQSSLEMQKDLSNKLLKVTNQKLDTTITKRNKQQRSQKAMQKSKLFWMESFVIIMVAFLFFVIYYVAI